MPVRKLTSEQRLSRAIDIMEALYAAGESGMTRTEICSRFDICLLYTSPSPRDRQKSRMPSSA